jgi:predicted dehydrogenase
MEKVKVAVIGLGGIAQIIHLPNLLKANNVRVTAVAEINKNRLNTIADKFNITERYTNYKELLEKSDCDAVIVATPTSTHKEIAISVLQAKKDVLVEKPLARTFEEAKPIVDAARKYKRKIMVGMNLRYRPDAMILRSLIKNNEIGIPLYVKCGWFRTQSSQGKWFTRKEESGGGVIIDLGILLLDLSLWLLNYPPVETVSTQRYFHNTKNVEDTSVSFIRCQDSSIISMDMSWSLPIEKDIFYLNLYGTKGTASLNPFRIFKRVEDQLIDLTPTGSESPLSLLRKSYLNELKSFIGAVRGLNPIFSSGEEALSRMKVVEAMYKSASENQEIKIKDL